MIYVQAQYKARGTRRKAHRADRIALTYGIFEFSLDALPYALCPKPIFFIAQYTFHNLKSKFELVGIGLEHRQKRRLGNHYLTHHFHAFFALFLFFEQFALTRDVSSVAFGGDVFS